MDDSQTILAQLTGRDRPGLSAGLFAVLAGVDAVVEDVEQVVMRHRLFLSVLITVPSGRDVLKELLLYGWENGLDIDFDVIADEPDEPVRAHAVTVIGGELSPAQLSEVTRAIADGGGNIDRIIRLARYPVLCYELLVGGGDSDEIRHGLLAAAAAHPGMDVAIQREGLGRRAKRLVVLDMDSTLIQNEVIDLLAAETGNGAEVERITASAMAGELDFETALRERVRLLAGLDEVAVERAWRRLELTPGARTFVRTLGRLGFRTGIVSGGFTAFSDRVARSLGIDHAYANELEMHNGRLTGELVGPVVDRGRKAEILCEIATLEDVPLEQTVAIGDGANDVDMLDLAGLGIAFNAKPVVREAADTALTVPYLDAILFLLGVSREEIEAADTADGIPIRPEVER